MIKIAPSILSADFSNLHQEIKRIEDAGCDLIHIDVMDGKFVPNISFGIPVIKSIRKCTKLPFDVHLMIEEPQRFIKEFVDAGADIITVHVESTKHLHRTIQLIKAHGKKASVALNPATNLETLEYVLEDIDMILLMTVNPGFGGQKYINNVTEKIKKLKSILNARKLNIPIEVDGGIDNVTSKIVINAGADILVAGSAVYGSEDIKTAIENLRN